MRILESLYEHWTEYILERNLDMNVNDELEKFRQRKAQEFFTQELPNRLKGFKAALEGTPEEIKKKLNDQEKIYVLDFWDKLDELTEQEKKTLELAGKTADMNYRQGILEMLNKIQSEKVLRYIWIIVSDICKDLGIKTDE